MENEEKAQGKHIYAIYLSPTSHQKNQTILKLDDQSHTRRKKKHSTDVSLKRLLFKI